MRDEENQIGAVLKGYTEGFTGAQVNVDALVGLWDGSEPEQVTYMPAESSTPLLSVEALRDYYKLISETWVITSGEVKNTRVRFLSGDLAYALCEFAFTYVSRANPDVKLAMQSRASIVLRKRARRWLYLQMHESMPWTPPVP